MVSNITKRIQRLEKVGAGIQPQRYLQSLTYEEKQAQLRELYSDLFEISPPLATQEEYEIDLLHRFPEVLQPGYKPPVCCDEMGKQSILTLCFQNRHCALSCNAD